MRVYICQNSTEQFSCKEWNPQSYVNLDQWGTLWAANIVLTLLVINVLTSQENDSWVSPLMVWYSPTMKQLHKPLLHRRPDRLLSGSLFESWQRLIYWKCSDSYEWGSECCFGVDFLLSVQDWTSRFAHMWMGYVCCMYVSGCLLNLFLFVSINMHMLCTMGK